MSFADIINQEQKKLEESNNNEKVQYPQTQHKRLFFEKGQREILMQILPTSDLMGAFAEPIRKIFLQAKSSQGKDLKVNFTLDPDVNEGSLLEKKIVEWGDKGIIPNGFGGQQTPRRMYLVNAVLIVQDQNQQFVQERDQNGNLVVRLFELPQSGYANLIRKLQDPLYNSSGSELSFMDINKPSPIKVAKPAKGQMEYPVEVYNTVALPPLGQGWENQLENLKEHATPTERLENGYQWVQAFVDMKEGRKPNSSNQSDGGQQQPTQQPPQANPYAGQGQGQQPMNQPPQQPSQPQQQPLNQPPQQPNGGQQTQPQPQAPTQPQQQPPQQPNNNAAPQPPQMPTTPQQPQAPQAPQQPNAPQAQQPQQAPQGQGQNPAPQGQGQPQPNQGDANANGLADIDAMLARELNNGN